MISKKETETLEFKKSTSELKEAIISIAAILNKHHQGGLYFGVKNNGEVIGQCVGSKTVRDISKAISDNIEPKIYPKIIEEKIEGRNCISVKFEGSETPYYAYGRAYMRVGDEDKKLSAKELENMILEKNKAYWDLKYSSVKLPQINEKVLRSYVQKGNDAKRITFEYKNKRTTLKKLGLIKDRHILKAADVLFCDENMLEVQAAVFASTDKTTFLDIKAIEGNLFEILKQTEAYIAERLNWRAEFKDFKRIEIPEIPTSAIREALVNSICHRDYFKPESNKVAIFKDRIEIWNPGEFPEGITPEDYIKGEEESVLRNPLIAKILYYSRDIEKWGSGLKRIYDECNFSKVKVEFKNTNEGFKVIFHRNLNLIGKLGEKLGEKLGGNQGKILVLISKNRLITIPELSKELKISTTAVENNLTKLKKKGFLLRIGPAKGGYWETRKFHKMIR